MMRPGTRFQEDLDPAHCGSPSRMRPAGRCCLDDRTVHRLVVFLALLIPAASSPAQSPLTYENWAQGFFTHNCLGCHNSALSVADRFGAPSDVNFDTLALIRDTADIIRDAALGDTPEMPPAGVVWWWDRVSLREWLDAGLPGETDTLAPVFIRKKEMTLSYEMGGMYFSNPMEDVFNNRYIGIYPNHDEHFEGTIIERYIGLVRQPDGTVAMNGREWYERNDDWSYTSTRLIEYSPPIPILLHGPDKNGEIWQSNVTAHERFWVGWTGGEPRSDETRTESWKTTNRGNDRIDNGVIAPLDTLKVQTENLTDGTDITWWYSRGMGLVRRETGAPSGTYIREITREMNIVTEQYPLYGPFIIEAASQEWMPFLGRWHSSENPNYDYWSEIEVQRIAVVDDSVGPAPTPTLTLESQPSETPVVPTATHTPFPPGLPSPQATSTVSATPTKSATPTDTTPPNPTDTNTPEAIPTSSPTQTTGPSPTSTNTLSGDEPSPTATWDLNDPHLSDYNGDNKVDVKDLVMFLQHWRAEME